MPWRPLNLYLVVSSVLWVLGPESSGKLVLKVLVPRYTETGCDRPMHA